MTGAGLPPIAIEAVLKLLAIGQESATTRRKTVKPAKPNLRLELTPATASFELPLTTRTATRTIAQRRSLARKPVPAKIDAEGTETC